jgi:hypothetical protein
MHSIRLALLATATAVAAAATALPAAACTLQSTPQGPRIADCNLGSYTAGRYDVDLTTLPPDPRRRLLPNLVPQGLSHWINGNQVEVSATVRNTAGIAGAPAYEIGTLLWLANPRASGNTVPGSVVQVAVPMPSLARMSSRTQALRYLWLPNRDQDWDVCAALVVDPMPAGGAAEGRVLESNEDDNQLTQCCRVYGPTPDVTGPPACR